MTQVSYAVVECIHHWIIDKPSGTKKSKGICKNCSEERYFYNDMSSIPPRKIKNRVLSNFNDRYSGIIKPNKEIAALEANDEEG